MKLSSLAPRWTPQGIKFIIDWLQFRHFLTDPTPLGISEAQSDLFFRYLPYAIALNAERQWLRRFKGQIINRPNWLTSAESSSLQTFTRQFLVIAERISHSFAALHGPIAE